MITMFNKKTNSNVEVYAFNIDNSMALCYNPSQAANNNGNGWQKCSVKNLIPLGYVNNGEYISKTERNNAKSQLKIVDAVWRCTDGMCFAHSNIEKAIDHQRELIKKENADNGE